MQDTFRLLKNQQLPSGQFPTTVVNTDTNTILSVHTIAPTYLICLMLSRLREQKYSHPLLDMIISRGVEFLSKMCYVDPISGLRVWHFNAFYPPDWEETAWSAYLLHEAGMLTKKELEPLRALAYANETSEKGVGVWLKDPYSKDNSINNVFDPVVSLSVAGFLDCVFGESSESTGHFIQTAYKEGIESLYYPTSFKDFFLYLCGHAQKPTSLEHDDYKLFHHGRRTHIWYVSPEVWKTAEFVVSMS